MIIVSAAIAGHLREAFGELPHDVIVTVQPPPRWPPGRPWPPEVTVPAAPCWKCTARPLPAPLDHLRILAR